MPYSGSAPPTDDGRLAATLPQAARQRSIRWGPGRRYDNQNANYVHSRFVLLLEALVLEIILSRLPSLASYSKVPCEPAFNLAGISIILQADGNAGADHGSLPTCQRAPRPRKDIRYVHLLGFHIIFRQISLADVLCFSSLFYLPFFH